MKGVMVGAQANNPLTRNRSHLECRALGPDLIEALSEFFRSVRSSGEYEFFHPHEFEHADAERLCNYVGQDFYSVLVDRKRVIGYGMLRGWDEGYSVPSLGICVNLTARGKGLGAFFMHYLHEVARHRGAVSVRLKVDKRNLAARRLYDNLGYSVHQETEEDFIMLKSL